MQTSFPTQPSENICVQKKFAKKNWKTIFSQVSRTFMQLRSVGNFRHYLKSNNTLY